MLLNSIKVNGMLSFRDVELEMRPLNVLVGPNASGKSNFIEIMALLQALPRDLVGFFRRSGGVSDWLWKGIGGIAEVGRLEATVDFISNGRPMPLSYMVGVSTGGNNIVIEEEWLSYKSPSDVLDDDKFWFFTVSGGSGRLYTHQMKNDLESPGKGNWVEQYRILGRDNLTQGQSVIREIRDSSLYPEMHYLTKQFDSIRLYRDWNMGSNSVIRRPQPTDSPTDHLYEDFSNLALVLNRLKREPVMPAIEEQLGRFYETYESLGVDIFANTAQLWIRERGLANPVPATRLSDGTLRFIALLTILCHPNPPPLICIEEPELGLHPDVIHQVAKLLIEASKRTQLIVTTHSAELIDHLWEDPESVVICERYPDTGTEFNRLKKEELESYLERYKLGELWLHGHIGGTRF